MSLNTINFPVYAEDESESESGSGSGISVGDVTLGSLMGEPRWCSWRMEPRRAGGDPTKVPYGSDNRRVTIYEDLLIYDRVSVVAANIGAPENVGIFLGPIGLGGGGWVLCGIDFDCCLGAGGMLAPWADEARLAVGPTFLEVSPSGYGLKGWLVVRADELGAVKDALGIGEGRLGRVWKGGDRGTAGGGVGTGSKEGIEFYTGGRWFAVTSRGHQLVGPGAVLGMLDRAGAERLAAVGSRWFGGGKDVRRLSEADASMYEPVIFGPVTGDDELALRRLLEEGSGVGVGGFGRLWAGDRSGLRGSDNSGSALAFEIGGRLRAGRVSRAGAALLMRDRCDGLADWSAKHIRLGDFVREFARIWAKKTVVGLTGGGEVGPVEVVGGGEVGNGEGEDREEEVAGGGLQRTDEGTPLTNFFNVMVLLRREQGLNNLLRFDEMAHSTILTNQIPNTPLDKKIPRQLRDTDILAIQEEIQRRGMRRVAKETVADGVMLRASQERFHPVHDYFAELRWDGVPRVSGMLCRYAGATGNSEYLSKVSRMFMVSMIARIMQPGCQCDYMIVLEGPQGALKSSFCRVLAGQWFSDNLPDLAKGDAIRVSMHLRGKWLIEIAEMSSFTAAETHRLKEFLTQRIEQYTPKFGRQEVMEPRQCVMIGSTNESVYLKDATGARRFWPVVTGTIDLEALKADRDQLFAEAMTLFLAGEPWWPEPEFERTLIRPEQEARYEVDVWEEAILAWLEKTGLRECTAIEVLKDALGLTTDKMGKREQLRVAAILRHMGWEKNMKIRRKPYVAPKA